MTFYSVVWGDEVRNFRSFEAAEKHARKRVTQLNDRGCSESAEIYSDMRPVASVRLDGADRVWTDMRDWPDTLDYLAPDMAEDD